MRLVLFERKRLKHMFKAVCYTNNARLPLLKVDELSQIAVVIFINPLSVNSTKWSNTLKKFLGCFQILIVSQYFRNATVDKIFIKAEKLFFVTTMHLTGDMQLSKLLTAFIQCFNLRRPYNISLFDTLKCFESFFSYSCSVVNCFNIMENNYIT